MKNDIKYVCPNCKATKTIRYRPHETVEQFLKKLPEKVVCGWRGCTYLAEREINA